MGIHVDPVKRLLLQAFIRCANRLTEFAAACELDDENEQKDFAHASQMPVFLDLRNDGACDGSGDFD